MPASCVRKIACLRPLSFIVLVPIANLAFGGSYVDEVEEVEDADADEYVDEMEQVRTRLEPASTTSVELELELELCGMTVTSVSLSFPRHNNGVLVDILLVFFVVLNKCKNLN